MKEKFPRLARRAVDALVEVFGCDTDLIEMALMRGLQSRPSSSFPYLRLLIEQRIGTPEQPFQVRTVVIHEHHES